MALFTWFTQETIFGTPWGSEKNMPFDNSKVDTTPFSQFSSWNQDNTPIDFVVIGSGLSGLTAAAVLAKAKKRVVVLEQHFVAGGCMHSFRKHNIEFDTGVHYTGGRHVGDLPGYLVDEVTNKRQQWNRLDDNEIFHIDGVKYDLPMYNRKKLTKALKELFPEEKSAIDILFKHVSDAEWASRYIYMNLLGSNASVVLKMIRSKLKKLYNYYSQKTTREILDMHTSNPTLRGIFEYFWADHGNPPTEASFLQNAMVMAHYLHGAFYPTGGSSSLSRNIIQTILENHGAVFVSARVKEILVTENGGKVTGVSVYTHPKKTPDTIDIPVTCGVISSAGAHVTLKELLKPEIVLHTGLLPKLEKLEKATCHVTIHFGFQGSRDELDLPRPQTWFLPQPSQISEKNMDIFNTFFLNQANTCFLSFPASKDPTYHSRTPGKSNAIMIFNSKFEHFEQWKDTKHRRRGSEYEAFKERIGEFALEQMFLQYPHLKEKLLFFDVSTPLTYLHYFGRPEGYGLASTPLRLINPIPCVVPNISGLHLTGQDISSVGVMSSCITGGISAGCALNRDLLYEMALAEKILNGTPILKVLQLR